jgi:hypothetical protein
MGTEILAVVSGHATCSRYTDRPADPDELAPLNGVIAAGIDEISPSGESHVTLWRWENGSSSNNNTSSNNSTGNTPSSSSSTTQGGTLYE